MTCKKPDNVRPEIWEQHLQWLELISDECKSNQLRRERIKRQPLQGAQRTERQARPARPPG